MTKANGEHPLTPSGKIVITGGSGFVGINLIRDLLAHGARDVWALDIAPFDYPELDRITFVRGDVRDAALVDETLRGARHVVHAAAALPRQSADEIRTTTVDGTRLVLAAAERHAIERVVFISTTAVYRASEPCPIREDATLCGVGPYGEAKILAERQCEAERGRRCVSIIRPRSCVGPERLGVFGLLYDWAKDGHNFPLLGSGDNRFQLLDVDDLCAAIRACLVVPPERANHTFNVGAREFRSMRADWQSVLDRAGRGKRVIPLPAAPLLFSLRAIERLGVSPIYAWVYEHAHRDCFVSIERAEQLLGFSPAYSNRDALVRNYDWYAAHAHEFQKSGHGVSHRTPWDQGALGFAKHLF